MTVKKDDTLHTAVLLDELVEAIEIQDKQNIIVDCTLWLAGHASQIIQKMNPWDIFVWFDADERNLKLAKQKLKHIQTKTQSSSKVQIVLIHSNFVNLKEELEKHNITSITGIYYDLGVSSLHFDEAERGFSFRLDGPLDMRFDTRSQTKAADILNYYEEKDIYKILKEYWEEPHSRKIAARILETRKKKKFQTTFDLVNFLDEHVNTHIKTKMRVFQALRIAVNRELATLKQSLEQAIKLLESGGNVFAISFHSLEDRVVKQTFKKEARDCICTDIICTCRHVKSLKILTKKPILPTDGEQKQNPRSRSAKARIGKKL